MTAGRRWAEPPRSAVDRQRHHGGTLNDRQRDVALFRYTLIREAADVALTKRERGELVREMASREHIGPDCNRLPAEPERHFGSISSRLGDGRCFALSDS